MATRIRHCWVVQAGIALLGLFSVGCAGPPRNWTDDVAWSPDGRHAAALIEGRLYISDDDDNLSTRLASNVYRVAWLGDSQRLALARTRTVRTFADVAAAVGAERSAAIVADAGELWSHIQDTNWPDSIDNSPELLRDDLEACLLYLREQHPDAMRAKFRERWSAIESMTVDLHALQIARTAHNDLAVVQTIFEDVLPIKSLRPSPDDRLLAVVTKNETVMSDETVRTFVVPVDGSALPVLIAERSGELPDWSVDGRTLLYFEAQAEADLGRGVAFGCLARRTALAAVGQPPIEPTKSCLAEVIFQSDDRIRSLRDGRVIFDVVEHHFPRAASKHDTPDGTGSRQLFAMNPERPDEPPVHLIPPDLLVNDGLRFFDVSPDRTRVVYSTASGRVHLWTIDGRSELLQLSLHTGRTGDDFPRIVWSGSDAFTYLRHVGARNELVVRRGESEVVLSEDWPLRGRTP